MWWSGLASVHSGFLRILHEHCTTTLTIFVKQYNIFCLTVKPINGRSILKRNRNLWYYLIKKFYNRDSFSFFWIVGRIQRCLLSCWHTTAIFLWLVQPCCWYMKKSGHGHPFDVPGLRKYGYREANHNWMSAMMTVLYVYGGREGDVRRCCCYCKSPHARPHKPCMLIRVQWDMQEETSLSRC